MAALGVVFALMNTCFYQAIARLPLGTVAAIEFLSYGDAALYALYIVLAHRLSRRGSLGSLDGPAAAMLVAAIAVTHWVAGAGCRP